MTISRGTLNADYKVTGGKLLRVSLSLHHGGIYPVISAITITGDFFMHPEDAIEGLENSLTGIPFTEDEVSKVVHAFFSQGVEVIGANSEDFTHVILSVT